jgi:Holliday junction DNA helicase RuvA
VIGRLRGRLASCELTGVTIDVNGVGYDVTVPLSTFDNLSRVGEEVELMIHTYVREDAILLFGFSSDRERALFRLLLGTSGIGPKLALNILSSIAVETFARYILDGDIKALSKVNGLGKRSAEKLIVELREKITDTIPEVAFGSNEEGQGVARLDAEAQDAMAALETLGFKPEQARKAIMAVLDKTPEAERSSENLIRIALATLNS